MRKNNITAPNRKARRAERSAKRSPFAVDIERLRDMPALSPFSLPSLNRYAKSGQLRTRKIGGTICVHIDDWKEFIVGTPSDDELSVLDMMEA